MKYGTVVITRTINDSIEKDKSFGNEIFKAWRRYLANDWGDMCEDDKRINDKALQLEEELNVGERVLAAYNTTKGKIYIITEWDRSATTILFANEY